MAKIMAGNIAPPFTLFDALTGVSVSFTPGVSETTGDTLLVFFRGTWCPLCRGQMQALRENYVLLVQAGVRVIGVICQSQGSVRHYLENAPVPFPILIDENRAVSKAYGVHYYLSLEGFNLAQPSIFIIDREGVVTFAHVGRGMDDMPVGEVIARFAGFLKPEPNKV